ncbi:MAG: hypothetical protein JXQ30_15140 [Spirochaetes bacterium]|nr:hypothetical protein [Spirochaetota bacterium]
MGHCFRVKTLDDSWEHVRRAREEGMIVILIVSGIFLSSRDDVIPRCVSAYKRRFPESLVVAG